MGGKGKENGMSDSSTDSGHEEPILRYSAGREGLTCTAVIYKNNHVKICKYPETLKETKDKSQTKQAS